MYSVDEETIENYSADNLHEIVDSSADVVYENLSAYFNARDWYHGIAYEEDFDMSVFNDHEWKNLNLLNAYDKEMGYQA